MNLDAVVHNEDQTEVIPGPPVCGRTELSHHRLHGISKILGSRCGPSPAHWEKKKKLSCTQSLTLSSEDKQQLKLQLRKQMYVLT